MKVIQDITDLIDEEISAADHYIVCAHKWKSSYPELSDTFFKLSLDELHHEQILHDEVEKLIYEYRRNYGTPPKEMMAVYEYIHNKFIERVRAVKISQDLYENKI